MALALLLHFNGRGTAIVDAVPGNKWFATPGATQIGPGAILGAGSLSVNSTCSVVSTTPALMAALKFGTASWRIDARLRSVLATAPPAFYTTVLATDLWSVQLRNSGTEFVFEGINPPGFGGTLVNGSPHLITVSFDSVSAKIYFFLDGTLVNTGGTAYSPNLGTPSAIYVGSETGLVDGWHSLIDEVRIQTGVAQTTAFTDAPKTEWPGPAAPISARKQRLRRILSGPSSAVLIADITAAAGTSTVSTLGGAGGAATTATAAAGTSTASSLTGRTGVGITAAAGQGTASTLTGGTGAAATTTAAAGVSTASALAGAATAASVLNGGASGTSTTSTLASTVAASSARVAAAGVSTAATLAGIGVTAAAITPAPGSSTASTLAGSSGQSASITSAAGVSTAGSLAGQGGAAAAITVASGVGTASTLGTVVSIAGVPTVAAGVSIASALVSQVAAASPLTAAAGTSTASTLVGGGGAEAGSSITPAAGVATTSTKTGRSGAAGSITQAAGTSTTSTLTGKTGVSLVAAAGVSTTGTLVAASVTLGPLVLESGTGNIDVPILGGNVASPLVATVILSDAPVFGTPQISLTGPVPAAPIAAFFIDTGQTFGAPTIGGIVTTIGATEVPTGDALFGLTAVGSGLLSTAIVPAAGVSTTAVLAGRAGMRAAIVPAAGSSTTSARVGATQTIVTGAPTPAAGVSTTGTLVGLTLQSGQAFIIPAAGLSMEWPLAGLAGNASSIVPASGTSTAGTIPGGSGVGSIIPASGGSITSTLGSTGNEQGGGIDPEPKSTDGLHPTRRQRKKLKKRRQAPNAIPQEIAQELPIQANRGPMVAQEAAQEAIAVQQTNELIDRMRRAQEQEALMLLLL